jgi:type IV pilus assembly protein PilM
MRFFVAAYPRQATDMLIATVKKAGLSPQTIEIAPLALARCVDLPAAVIVNSWLTFLDIVVLTDRIPQVIRSVSLPIESTSIEDRLPAIFEEVTRTITFYNASKQGTSLEKSVPMVICGDLAQQPSWKPLEKMGYPVQAFKPAMVYKPAFDPAQYAVNCGLALKGQKAGDKTSIIDFNILPESYRPTPFSWGRVLAPIAIAAAVVAIGWGYMMVREIDEEVTRLEVEKTTVNQDLVRQRAGNNALKDSIKLEEAAALAFPPRIALLEKQALETQDLEGFFTRLNDDYIERLENANLDVNMIVAQAAGTLLITNLEVQSDGFTVSGRAAAEADILAYGRSLMESGRFSVVLINNINTVESDEGTALLDFIITIR